MSSGIYKIVVLGEGRVGKTSISIKYVRNEFDHKQKETVNASYLEKKVTLDNQQQVKLTIWDTAGQEEFNSVAPIYYREAAGAIVCYDITSLNSFHKARKWILELEQNAPKNIVISLVGNKADLQNSRNIPKNQAQKYAADCGATHTLVSAKNGQNIDLLFKEMAERVHAVQTKNKNPGPRRGPKLTVERGESKVKAQKSKCC